MTKDWFKYLPVVYKNEDKCYVQATSSFDESMNLNLAGKKLWLNYTRWEEKRMIETGKRVLGLIFELGKIIKLLMIINFEITNNLDEITHIQLLFWQCWINYRSYYDQGILWYKRTWLCEKLLNFVKTLKMNIINLKIFVKKHWKNNFQKISIKKIIKITKYKQACSKTTMDRKKILREKKYLFLKKYILKKNSF